VPTAHEEAAVNWPVGETLSVLERLIVAPTGGIFHRPAGALAIRDGDLINRGDVMGAVQSLASSTPIQSPFKGSLVAILAVEGERLRPGQPVAWLRIEPSQPHGG
jgi:biotin carboxyl carrier protein